MPRTPEQPPRPEALQMPFLLSSRFDSKQSSQAPYDAIQAIVRDQDVDFSVFRVLQNWPEAIAKAPPSKKLWYVAVIGNVPPEPIAKQVSDTINQGEVVPLPDEVILEFAQRRLEQIAKRPYTEIHRKIIISKGGQNKEKLKRKMQKNSRRQNRGK